MSDDKPCPYCGAKPVTDPNQRNYHTSAAWECGTATYWVQQGKTRQSAECQHNQESSDE
jgi:hypothetical protein